MREATLADLRGADAGGCEHVPSLDEVLDLVAGRITVMCELKVSPGRSGDASELLAATVAAIRGHDAAGWAALHSFDHGRVERARTVAPEIPTALIAPALARAELEALCARAVAAKIEGISLDHRAVGRTRGLRRPRARPPALGLDRRCARRLAATHGCGPWEGIITNRPAALRAWGEGNSDGQRPRLPA